MCTFETTVSTMKVVCNGCELRSCFMTVLQNEYANDEDLLADGAPHRCPFDRDSIAKFEPVHVNFDKKISEEAGRIVFNDLKKVE